MPKIEEIEDTPNPNTMKFTLKEPLTWGITRSYENAGQTKDDPLAAALFDIEHVTNVFYVDLWLTVTQDGDTDMTTKTTSLTAATKHPQDKQRGSFKTKRDEINPALTSASGLLFLYQRRDTYRCKT